MMRLACVVLLALDASFIDPVLWAIVGASIAKLISLAIKRLKP